MKGGENISSLLDELIDKHGKEKVYFHLCNLKNDGARYDKDLTYIRKLFIYAMKVFDITEEDLKQGKLNRKTNLANFRKVVSFLLLQYTPVKGKYVASLLNVNELESYRYKQKIQQILDTPQINLKLYKKFKSMDELKRYIVSLETISYNELVALSKQYKLPSLEPNDRTEFEWNNLKFDQVWMTVDYEISVVK